MTSKWLGLLGKLVSAAGNRDASVWDQAEQVATAHTELYDELRRMDEVQAELMEALEDLLSHNLETDGATEDWSGLQISLLKARAAIAKARGEA